MEWFETTRVADALLAWQDGREVQVEVGPVGERSWVEAASEAITEGRKMRIELPQDEKRKAYRLKSDHFVKCMAMKVANKLRGRRPWYEVELGDDRHHGYTFMCPEFVFVSAFERQPEVYGDWENPHWEHAGRVRDWRNHVGEEIKDMWDTFSDTQKQAIQRHAEKLANEEEWD
jgi:hypothetical protein